MINNELKIRNLSTSSDVFNLTANLQDKLNIPEFIFDFSDLNFAKTVATALLARELRWFVNHRKNNNLMTYCKGHDSPSNRAVKYLAFIGFFDFIGLKDCGNPMRTEAEADRNYTAITQYDYRRFKSIEEVDVYRKAYDYINDEAGKISKLLTKGSSRDRILQYAIRETMRNAYEHSTSVNFHVLGQCWANGGVELVIMDGGVGLQKTLNHKYPHIDSEEKAIKEAIKPGVSGRDFDVNNEYDNSGFGLYVLSEFAKKYGQIFIASNDCMIQLSRSGEIIKKVCPTQGTLVGLHFSSIPESYPEELSEIIIRGDQISGQGTYPIHPSKNTWNF